MVSLHTTMFWVNLLQNLFYVQVVYFQALTSDGQLYTMIQGNSTPYNSTLYTQRAAW